ncbi:protein ENHANCED DISEASE RESISTANCE 4 [Euphorbia lathyris]|uniref:protein ENHANCED DISEASE RESISTANCE 4 n=1 Tax=Euphorbia lathyris TaxID=212925 RepID=UPI003313EE38
MADSTKVRLVRCPKCENLLPELENYSVYQCGGCGAVLRAKTRNRETDALLDEPQIARDTAELHNSLERGVVELSDTSDADIKSNTGSLSCDEKNPEKNEFEDDDGSRNQAKANGKWVVENDLDMDMNIDILDNAVGREIGNLNSETRHTSKSWRSGQMSGWECGEKAEAEGFQSATKTKVEGVRFSTSNYPDEGPSSYNVDSNYSYGEPLRNHGKSEQHLEKDRVELLRKLDELKEQLSRSCDVAEKSKEKAPLNGRRAPLDPYSGADTWFPGASTMPDRASMQFFGPDKHAARPPYSHHYPDPFPYTNGHEMAMHNLHPAVHNSNHIPGFGDPFGVKRGPHQLSGQYHQPPRQYYSRHYFDANSDPYNSYASNVPFHQPSCSCFHCYERHHRVPAPVPATNLSNKRRADVSTNPMLYQHENPGEFGPYVHNSRAHVPPFDGPLSYARWPSDLNSDMGRFAHSRPRKVVLASGGRCCLPVAGGAPFMTCSNCFELLQVPKKVLLKGKNHKKVRCGSCSAIINFSIVNKKLVFSVNTVATQIPAVVDDSSTELIKESTSYPHAFMSRMNANFSSDDYDTSGYDFQTVDADPIALSAGQVLNSLKHQEMNSFHTSSPSTTDDENSPDALIAPRNVVNSVQQPVKDSLSPPPAGSPLQHHFEYSSTDRDNSVNRFGKGNQSARSEQEKVIGTKATIRQNSMKEASLATEIEVPFHEYSNTGVSQESSDANREDSQLKINKGGESFFANIIKKSFKDFSRSNQTDERGRSNVSINGHLIPDRLVKKAEKIAGPVHPGQYWYDVRAGFWGVVGGPCLGIIPPCIEEFNYAMPEKCAGGNTGVYVNGRELHQKDLDLLAGRGLPIDRDRSYILEITGRVVDEDTGEELDSLGRLAPTVEKVKHGFGMKVPKAAVGSK